MVLNLDFMKYIKEPVICITDEHEVKYENGSAAEEFYKTEDGKYAAQNITVKDDIITISLLKIKPKKKILKTKNGQKNIKGELVKTQVSFR